MTKWYLVDADYFDILGECSSAKTARKWLDDNGAEFISNNRWHVWNYSGNVSFYTEDELIQLGEF